MKEKCVNKAVHAIQIIRRVEQLKEKSRFADTFGFDVRFANTVLDEANNFINSVGVLGYLDKKKVEEIQSRINKTKGELPATAYVPPDADFLIPIFDDIADELSTAAFAAVVKCECK